MTPFARKFTDTSTPHRFESSNEWNGLPVCCRCGGLEGALLATCPVQHMTTKELDLAYTAFLNHDDYRSPAIHEYNQLAGRFNDALLDAANAKRRAAAFQL